VRREFAANNKRLKRYRNAGDATEFFNVFVIKVAPREHNVKADALAVATSTLHPCDELISRECNMEIIFRTSVPDNFEHWQVFHDDAQILRFLNNLQDFSKKQVNWQEEEDDDNAVNFENLPDNRIPHGVFL